MSLELKVLTYNIKVRCVLCRYAAAVECDTLWTTMSPAEFDDLVEQALKVVPPRFRRRLKNVVFVVEPEPPRPGLLGLYHGRPLTRRSVSDGFTMPDQITIYQGPHERMARNKRHLRELVRETIWHEVAHYFGMDERQVRQAERNRRRPS